MKRLLSIILTVAILLSMSTTALAANQTVTKAGMAVALVENLNLTADISDMGGTFPDVPLDADYYDAVMICFKLGIMTGMSDGTFRPEDLVSRAEAATMLSRAGVGGEPLASVPSDVSTYSWYYYGVCDALASGAMSTYSDGYFAPMNTAKYDDINWNAARANRALTRAEFATLIASHFSLTYTPSPTDVQFSDVAVSDTYYQAVMACVQAGLMNGSSDSFYPLRSVPRSESATVFHYTGIAIGTPSVAPTDLNSVSSYYVTAINGVIASCIMSTYSDGGFYAGKNTLRSDINWDAVDSLVNPSSTAVQLDLSLGSIEILGSLGGGAAYMQGDIVTRSSGGCIVRQSNTSAPSSNTISVSGPSTDLALTIVGLNIESSASPIELKNGANVRLNLVDNSELKATGEYNAGVAVPEGTSLTIVGNGSVNSTGGYYGAGIGGGGDRWYNHCGNLTINSGTITATSDSDGAGIGGGNDGNGGIITINGGTITATGGGRGGAGIGGGNDGNGGIITINGGTIIATGGFSGAGIGGGDNGDGGSITITGGNVTAACTAYGYAAIGGGGDQGHGGTVTITGGEVTANGKYYAIGGGGVGNQYACDAITIGEDVVMHPSHTHSSGTDYIERIDLTQQPLSEAGHTSVQFAVVAIGHSGLTYQWQVSQYGSSGWVNLVGEAGATVDIPVSAANEGLYYRCMITNGWGNTLETNSVARSYVLAFSKQPASVEVNLNDMISLSATSTCSNVFYHWERSYDDGTSWVDVPGETYSTLIVSATLSESNALYRCIITATNGDELASDTARITVDSSAITYTTRYYLEKPDGSGYDLGDQVVTEGSPGASVTAPTKTFEHFIENAGKGTTSGTVKADSSLVLSRYYDRVTYTVSFVPNGGSAIPAITDRYGAVITAPTAPSRTGHTFSGWYEDESLTQPYTFTTMPGGNITLYAKWELVGGSRGIEYSINAITLRDSGYQPVSSIQPGGFYAEVSVTNLSSTTLDTLILATYDSRGAMLDTYFLYANPQVGQTFILGAYIKNQGNNVAHIKAFMLPMLGGLVPLAEAVEFPK